MSFKSPLRALPGYRMGREAAMGLVDLVYYLIRDEFITARATGSVDGTAAEPGPGTRNVTDLDSRITITGGALTVAAGGASAWGRTGFWMTPGITRVAGQVIKMDVNWPNFNTLMFGLTTTASASNAGYNNYGVTNGSVGYLAARKVSAGTSPDIVAYSLSTDYTFVFILRNIGKFILRKNTTDYQLLWMDAWVNDATVYIGATHYNNSIQATYDNVKAIQNKVYAIPALASDSFNRANGSLGSTDGAGYAEAAGGSGLAWTAQLGTWGVAANKAAASALAGGVGAATVNAGDDDVWLSAELTRSGNEVGVVARWANANNYLRAYHDGTNVKLDEVVGGVPNNLISAVAAYAAGATIALATDGQAARLFYNELNVGTTAVIDASLTATAHGLYTTNTGNTFDNFNVFARNGYADLGDY